MQKYQIEIKRHPTAAWQYLCSFEDKLKALDFYDSLMKNPNMTSYYKNFRVIQNHIKVVSQTLGLP